MNKKTELREELSNGENGSHGNDFNKGDIFTGKSINEIVQHILNEGDTNIPFTSRKSFVNENGDLEEHIILKDCNLLIEGGLITNIYEISVPPILDEDDSDKTEFDITKANIYLEKKSDKTIDYGNIETDIAKIIRIDGKITEIQLFGRIYDNDGDDSTGQGRFSGKLKCILEKTKEGYIGKIETRDYDKTEGFRNAAQSIGFTEEEARNACFSSITVQDLDIYLGDKKYDNKTLIGYLENDDEQEFGGPIILNVGNLNGTYKEPEIEHYGINKKIKLIMGGFAAGILILLSYQFLDKTFFDKERIESLGELKLDDKPSNHIDKNEIISTTGTIIINSTDGLVKEIKKYMVANNLKGETKFWNFLKSFNKFDPNTLQKGDVINFTIKKKEDGSWYLVKLKKSGQV